MALDVAKLVEWQKANEQLTFLKAHEMQLRKEVFAEAFPTPIEGTNKLALDDAHQLTAQYKLNRKLDDAALIVSGQALYDQGVPLDKLVVYKPELKVAEFKALQTEDNAKFQLFAQLVTESPGSPTLSITMPKRGVKST